MNFDLSSTVFDFLHLALAFALASPIGYNREREARSAGVRTFPIVAIASCGLALVGQRIPNATAESNARILEGLITGIGFIGGGAILKDRGTVVGTATAASVWCIGIVGAAVAFGMYQIAITLSVVNFLTLKLLAPLKSDGNLPGEYK